MAIMTDIPNGGAITPSHDYHAEAHVLSGDLQRPVVQKIERQSPVTLKDRRGGHLTRFTDKVSIEGLISFTRGHARVSGSRNLKNNGWVTLSTSMLEGLNVFEVITADRLVSQVSTDHPYEDGHEPHVTFLGTKFTNLEVSGFPVSLTLNFEICGERPTGGKSYFNDSKFLGRVKDQTEKVAGARGLPKELKHQYDEKLAYIKKLIGASDASGSGTHEPFTCSLVQSIGEIPIPGVQSFGNVLVIPEFGTLTLGEIEVGERVYEGSKKPSVYFELTCAKMKLGCVGDGTLATAASAANGRHYP
jgi:hypothetical protein